MNSHIIIPRPEDLEAKIIQITADGASNLHILADFDRTLTMCFKDGERSPTLIHTLMEGGYLTPDYPAKAKALFDHYRAIELDPSVPPVEMKRNMEEWWRKHFDLFIASGLTRKDVERAVMTSGVALRPGINYFLDVLHEHNVPLIIFSASGLGGESIELFFKNTNQYFSNIHLVANSFAWDENGRIKAVNEPIIHSANKDETLIKDFPCYLEIKNRRNVILLGDNLEDVGMIDGFEYKALIKIGFLNEREADNMVRYSNNFDVLITGDGPLDYVNELINRIIKQ